MKKLVMSVFLALCVISIMAQSPVNMKLNLEKGKLYTIKSTSKQAIQQTYNGQQFVIDVQSNSVITCKVLQQVNDVMDMEFKFDTIASKISSPMFNKESNSAKPAGSDPQEIIMNKLSTYKLVAKISTAGKFISFVNYGKFKDSVLFVMDSIPATKRDDARKTADALLKETALQSMVEPLFAYLPEKEVKTNDNWETSFFIVASNISMLSLNSYSLKGVENNQANVTGSSEIESMPSNDPNAQMTQELKGKSTFDGSIDLKTGLIEKSTSKTQFEGTTTVKNNGVEMKMPMKIDGETLTIMSK